MAIKDEKVNPCLVDGASANPDKWYITRIRNPLDPEAAD